MILCSGCFDGLHIGHVRYLQAAARLNPCERLVVAVASDAYIRTQKFRIPTWFEMDRAAVVAGLSCVSRAVIHGLEGAADVILDLKPALFVKGIDWEHGIPLNVRAACETVGAQIVIVDSGIARHTSDAVPPLVA